MKYFKKLGIYKASNVTFNPATISAHSYGHWQFVAVINGLVIFNAYRYSPSTGRQQSKVRRLMGELGIVIDLKIETKLSLSNPDALEDAMRHAKGKALLAEKAMVTARARKVVHASVIAHELSRAKAINSLVVAE